MSSDGGRLATDRLSTLREFHARLFLFRQAEPEGDDGEPVEGERP